MSRKHGFELPLHPMQISSWLVVALMVVLNYLVVHPALGQAAGVAFLCVYSLLQAGVLLLGGILTAWDPTDKVVYRHRAALDRK